MKILYITQWFDPEPTPKGLFFVKKLISMGHEVKVLTSIPNYPIGKFYPGYKFNLYKSEILDEVEVFRVPLFPSHDQSTFKRIITYLTFSITSFIFGISLSRKVDLIYAYHPPNVGLVAYLLSKIRKIPYVHDVQDLWPDTFLSTSMIKKRKVLNLIDFFTQFIYRKASSIIAISPGFKDELIQRGIKEEKVTVIYNWCDEKNINNYNENDNKFLSKEKFNIVFAGNIGKAQDLRSVMKAAKELQNLNKNIRFSLIGDGVELKELEEFKKEKNIENVEFIPRVSSNEIGAYLSSADVLLVHLKDDSLFKITIPSKVQAYLSSGKPILSNVSGDAEDLIEKAEAGITVLSKNTEDFIAACIKLANTDKKELKNIGLKGKKYYEKNLSLECGTLKTHNLFRDVIKNNN